MKPAVRDFSEPTHVTAAGIVLCGGKSARMGAAKATLTFGPETMLQRVVRLLGTAVHPVIVVAASEQVIPILPKEVIVTHDERAERGPLEGLRAGLRALPASVETAYVTGCDVPLLVPGFAARMIELLGGHDIAALEIDSFAHPFPAVCRKTVLAQVETLLQQDILRVGALIDTVRTRRVKVVEVAASDPQLSSLRNLNTREEYLKALAEAGF